MNSEREKYDRIADRISMSEKFYETALSLSLNNHDHLVLIDVGCGQGLLIRKIVKKFRYASNIIGLEFSKELVTRANKIPDANAIMTNVLTIPLKDNSVDLAFCTEVIEHTKNPRQLLKEIYRVLKPGGTLILTVPNRLSFYPFYAIIRRIPIELRRNLFRHFSCWLLPDDDPAVSFQPIDHAYSSKEVLKWIQNDKYEILTYIGYSYLMNANIGYSARPNNFCDHARIGLNEENNGFVKHDSFLSGARQVFVSLPSTAAPILQNLLSKIFSPIFAYNFFVSAIKKNSNLPENNLRMINQKNVST